MPLAFATCNSLVFENVRKPDWRQKKKADPKLNYKNQIISNKMGQGKRIEKDPAGISLVGNLSKLFETLKGQMGFRSNCSMLTKTTSNMWCIM